MPCGQNLQRGRTDRTIKCGGVACVPGDDPLAGRGFVCVPVQFGRDWKATHPTETNPSIMNFSMDQEPDSQASVLAVSPPVSPGPAVERGLHQCEGPKVLSWTDSRALGQRSSVVVLIRKNLMRRTISGSK